MKEHLHRALGSRTVNVFIAIWAGIVVVIGVLYATPALALAISFCAVFSALTGIYASEQYRLATAQYRRVAEMLRVLSDNTEARTSLTQASMDLERETRELDRRAQKILARQVAA